MGQSNGSRWAYSYLPQGMAGGATSALIPLYTVAIGGNLATVGIIAAATSIASVPAFILWGGLSDRLERRKLFLLIGFLGTAVSFFAMALSPTLPAFYLANLLIGFLGAASAPVGVVLVMETAEEQAWPARLAFLSRLTGVGWIAGLSVGVVWLILGPAFVGSVSAMRGLFVIGGALALASAILAALWLREPAAHVRRHEMHLAEFAMRIERLKFLPFRVLHYFDPHTHLSKPSKLSGPLKIYLVSVFLLFSGFTAFYGFFPILLQSAYGFSNPEIFSVYIASQVASASAYGAVGRWVSIRGSRLTQLYAVLGRSALFPAFLALGAFQMPLPVLIAVCLGLHAGVGLCWAVINVSGSTLVSRLARSDARAAAFGAFNAVQGFGSILGPLLGGFLAEFYGYVVAMGAVLVFVLAGAGILAARHIAEDRVRAPVPA
jgi:MFS family permease